MGFLSSELLLLEQPSFFAVWFVRAVERKEAEGQVFTFVL